MVYRNVLEFKSRGAAGVIEEVGNYQWVRVLDMFEMYALKGDESVSPHLVRDGFWESWITAWVMDNVGPDTKFWDVGANTGYYSFLAHSLGAHVAAFEPNPVYADMMQATAERHGLNYGFKLHRYALSDRDGAGTLHIPVGLHGSASLNEIPPGYEFDNIQVTVRRWDGVYGVAGSGNHVIKIDAEGEEERVLAGANQFLNTSTDITILLEHTPGAYSKTFLEKLELRWSLNWINGDGVAEPVEKSWIRSQKDWVMLALIPRW